MPAYVKLLFSTKPLHDSKDLRNGANASGKDGMSDDSGQEGSENGRDLGGFADVPDVEQEKLVVSA